MKKILYVLLGASLLLAGCTEKSYYIEQNPYRKIVEYTPQTFTMEIAGTLTPAAQYDWITVSQSGNTASFTVRRNTTGLVREADYTMTGSDKKAKVFQRAHSLDANLTSSLISQGRGFANINVFLATSYLDDYASWGVIYGKENNREKGKKVEQTTALVKGDNLVTITGLEEDTDYFVWAYVVSTEGQTIYTSNVTGIVPPVYVQAGEDLQGIIDNAKEFSDLRVEGDAVFNGPIYLRENVKLTGGWVEDFSKQSIEHRTVIQGDGANSAVFSGYDATAAAIGSSNSAISYFEIKGGKASVENRGGGIMFTGKLTVEYCWIHDNYSDSRGGGIGNSERGDSDELLLANTIVERNMSDAHGAGVSVCGTNNKLTMVNCLVADNESIATYGYSGAVFGQGGMTAILVNNTITGNVNWRDGSDPFSSPWGASMFRNEGTHVEFVNNIFAGNYYWMPGHEGQYGWPYLEHVQMMQVQQIDINVIGGDDPAWICQSNLIGGTDPTNFIGRAGNGEQQSKAQSQCTFVHNDNFATIFTDASAGNYVPKADGPAAKGENSDYVVGILGSYMTDLAGNPRVSNGTISIGCYQVQ